MRCAAKVFFSLLPFLFCFFLVFFGSTQSKRISHTRMNVFCSFLLSFISFCLNFFHYFFFFVALRTTNAAQFELDGNDKSTQTRFWIGEREKCLYLIIDQKSISHSCARFCGDCVTMCFFATLV